MDTARERGRAEVVALLTGPTEEAMAELAAAKKAAAEKAAAEKAAAKKAAVEKAVTKHPEVACIPADLLAVLQGFLVPSLLDRMNLKDETAALQAAGAWCNAHEPRSVDDIREAELVDDLIGALQLPNSVWESKLRNKVLSTTQ